MEDLAKRIAALSPQQKSQLALRLDNLAPDNGSSLDGDRRIVSYIVPKPEHTLTVDSLRAFLKQRLPDYMFPSAFEFLETLPVTETGKIDRKALPEIRGVRPELTTDFVMPKTAIEQALAAIWRSVLQVDKVGVQDNFFDLGGHSLLLIQVHARLKEVVKDVSVIDLFKYPTIGSLARYLASSQLAGPAVEENRIAPVSASEPVTETDIAIVGMAGRFPQARNLEEFWTNLRDGVESIRFFTPEDMAEVDPQILADPNYVGAKATLDGIEQFDAAFFGFSPREAETLDPQQRLYLECAWEALENAGLDPDTDQRPVGVFAGASPNTYLAHNILANPEAAKYAGTLQTRIANDANHLPTLASYKLNLKGPSLNVQTACSTSLVAVHLACQSLLNRECDIALAGGVSIGVPQNSGYLHESGGIFSSDGHCRAFDASADGTVAGSGAGIVVLKRLADAIADGDSIRALIKGTAVNNDGSHKVGYTAPSIDGEAQVIAAAHARAKVDPASISYVETHGTGTHLGDPIEITALTEAFAGNGHSCAVGSVKTNIGHLDAAAGVAGLIKTVLALEKKQLPPSLHFVAPNPKIDFGKSPFYVNTRLTDWEANGTPRRAGVSSFGMGGTNIHLVLEEAPPFVTDESEKLTKLLVLSAKTPSALETATTNLLDYLDRHPEQQLADVAYTLQVGRRAFNYRRVIVCRDAAEARSVVEGRDAGRLFDTFQEARERPVVFMFPGQGAQYINMGQELYQTEPSFRRIVDQCADLLEPQLGLDLRQLLYPNETVSRRLTETAFAQPALFVIEYALAQLWMERGVQPEAMIGHSIGEYVAACIAGVFSLNEALELVAVRGRMMQELPGGAMIAVPLAHEELKSLLGDSLSVASINGANQSVISGTADGIEDLQRRLARLKIESTKLHTSHAFHSQMMEPILESFAGVVAKTTRKAPVIPYISNVTGTWIKPSEAVDPQYWARHLRQTVRFAGGLNVLAEDAQRIFLEVGPGHGLTSLSRRRRQVLDAFSTLRHAHDRCSDAEFLARTTGLLWANGVHIDWSGLYRYEHRRRVSLPTYPFERRRYWIERVERSSGDQVSVVNKRPLKDWFYVPSWKRTAWPNVERAPQAGEAWVIFLGGNDIGAGLAEQLRRDQITPTIVMNGEKFKKLSAELYTLNFGEREEYQVLFDELRLSGTTPVKVIYLPALGDDRESAAGVRSFYGLLFLAQALVASRIEAAIQIEVVTNGSEQVLGDEWLSPEKSLSLAVCTVLPQERPNITCRFLDVAMSGSDEEAKLIRRLLTEFKAPVSDTVIAYRGDHRWTKTFEPLQLEEPASTGVHLRDRGVYLLIGGLGNVGYVFAEHLARTANPRLILVQRTELPARTEWENWLETHNEEDPVSAQLRKIKTLESLGAEVMFYSANVADEERMREVVDQCGELNGVVYAAGSTDQDRFMPLLDATTVDDCEKHFQSKVHGLSVLEKVLKDRELDFCLLCSSLSAVLGGLGFAAYSAANMFMDTVAQRRRSLDKSNWISVNWDAWQFDSDTEPRAFASTDLAKLAITPEEGVQVFERLLSSTTEPQVIVSTGNLNARVKRHLGAQAPEREASEALSFYPRPETGSAYVAPRNETEQLIAGIWQELLGLERVGINDNFFGLGGHSLLATRVNIRLRETFQVDLPLQKFFQSPTVCELADAVLEQLIERQDGQEIEQLFADVQQSSAHN